MWPVIKWTVWQRRFSTIWWSVGAFVLLFVSMITYPAFKDSAKELEKSFENLPDAALQLFGGSSDFFSPVGFTNSQIFFITLPLLLSILAIGLGSNLLAREEQDQTMETLLARPVSRSRLLAAKILAGVSILLGVSLVSALTVAITAKIVDLNIGVAPLVGATAVCFLLALSTGAIAFLFTAIGRARGAALGIAALIAMGGYVVSSLAGTVSWLEIPSKIFPFTYYQSEAILRGAYDWINVLFFIGLPAACGLLSWVAFRRRDIG